MSDASQEALTRAFVGVSYLLGARAGELRGRRPVHVVAERLTTALADRDQLVRARAVAGALLAVSRDLDRRRIA